MARDLDSKCKKCRRAGEKLFLKGDRCDSAKCAMVRRAYPPGAHGKSISRGLSEYGKQLAMKQKTKRMYGILERQFRKHFEQASKRKGVTGDELIARLELRLDNVVKRVGFADSPSQARQIVSHGLIKINGKKVNIPSYEVKVGDSVSFNELKKEKRYFIAKNEVLKVRKNFPAWLEFDNKKMEAKVVSVPSKDDMDVSIDTQMIVEYYSR